MDAGHAVQSGRLAGQEFPVDAAVRESRTSSLIVRTIGQQETAARIIERMEGLSARLFGAEPSNAVSEEGTGCGVFDELDFHSNTLSQQLMRIEDLVMKLEQI